MEVQIINKQVDTVQVNTAFGCFSGIWCSLTPVIFKKYIVELESDDILTSDVVELSDSINPHIEYVDQAINITGLVEEVQDEVMVLRLQKSIILLEISSDIDFIQYIGRFVRNRKINIRKRFCKYS